MKFEKETAFKFLKKLNKELSFKFSQMKLQFERQPPERNEIRSRFLDWKGIYDQLVLQTLKQCQEVDEKSFDFKEYIIWMTEQFSNEQQFLQLLKNVNNSIQNLKDFVRIKLLKDPSIYTGTPKLE